MKTMDTFNALLEKQKELETVQAELHQESLKLFQKVQRLHSVGRSVISKKYGMHAYFVPENDLGSDLAWLSKNISFVRLSANGIIIKARVVDYKTKTYVDGEMTISVSQLAQSDRDFAKKVRQAIYAQKKLVAEREIARLEAEKLKLEKEREERINKEILTLEKTLEQRKLELEKMKENKK